MRGFIIPALACLLLVASTIPSYAETLDDASIRSLFSQRDAINEDTSYSQFMEKHVDNGFILHDRITVIDPGKKPKTHIERSTKKEAVESSIAADKLTKDSNASNNNISSIQYFDDHKYAIVTYSNTETGSLADPDSPEHAHYETAQSCIEKVALVDTLLKFMSASCISQYTFHP